MTEKAFILFETTVGKNNEVVANLGKLRGVKSVDAVTGPYDGILIIEAESVSEIGDLITGQIQCVDGVSRTVTCVAQLCP